MYIDRSKNRAAATGGRKGNIMKKTFYSVTYSVWGSSFSREAWFDSKSAAEAFAAHDYRDDPVSHTYSKADSIRAAEERVAATAAELIG